MLAGRTPPERLVGMAGPQVLGQSVSAGYFKPMEEEAAAPLLGQAAVPVRLDRHPGLQGALLMPGLQTLSLGRDVMVEVSMQRQGVPVEVMDKRP